MAKFTSRFPELGFYVDGELRKFHAGVFITEDKAEIAALTTVVDAVREDQPTEEAPKAPVKKAPVKSSEK